MMRHHTYRPTPGPGQVRHRTSEETVAVIIINFNSGDYLVKALASAAQQNHQPNEIIVIDNGSSDDSLDRVNWTDYDTVRLIRLGRNTGFAAASNLGAVMARSSWLAMLNCDATAEPDWLDAMLSAARRNPHIALFSSTQKRMDAPEKLDGAGDVFSITGLAWRGGFGRVTQTAPPEGLCFGACAAGAFISRRMFLELGGFEESFFCYLEDLDFSYRAHLAGYDCLYVPEAEILHKGSASSETRQEWPLRMSARNRILLYLRNTPMALALLTWPFLLIGAAVSVAQGVRHGSPMAVLKGYADVIRCLPEAMAQRRALSPPWLPPQSLLRTMSWNPFAVLSRRPVVLPIARGPAHNEPSGIGEPTAPT